LNKGIPAQYGDAVGGIINITTSSPSSTIQGGIEAETSAPLDQYNTNLLSFNLTGPLL
jgi:outer membrane receptor for ferrienterochelin and colicin